jgi:hypothetical protein
MKRISFVSRSSVVCTILTAALVVCLASPAAAGNNIVVTLRGVGGLMLPEDNPPLPDPALCFETELFDTKTDRLIGSGIDCLEDLVTYDSDGTSPGVDDFSTVELTRTTFFYFRRGTMAATGRTTVAAIFEGSPGPPSATHIVGDITGPGGDNILTEYGTRRFRNKSGSVRLSGAVDLSALETLGEIGFNCVFVIDLD